jgi:S1-C subfamily serine protease
VGGAPNAPADVAEIAAKVDPAIVDVDVQFSYQNAEGAGTGIVLRPNGLVLTNNHVIDESTRVSVTDIGNGRTYEATVLGYDSTHDVALLKLQGASGLPFAKIARARARLGQAVVAIGNAGGTGGTPVAAAGTVIALDQDITASDSLTETSEKLTGLIETSADVQSGDSGGPLVNTAGQVLGIDTAATGGFAFSQTGNQGYAIPIERAMAIAKDIEAGRETATVHVGPTAFIGLRLYSQSNASPFQLPRVGSSGARPTSSSGLEVYAVIPGTGAAKAGLAQGDVLTSFNGAQLSSDAQLARILVRYHPGEKAEVGWVTPKGKDESATIRLTSGPPA